MKSKSIFILIIFMVNIASPAIADEDNIFEGSKPINVQRILEVTEDLVVADAAEQVNRLNVGDTDNITKNIETWKSFKEVTGENGTFVGSPFEENVLRINDSGAVIVSGLMRAPSDAIMSGASEGWMRIPLDLNVNETYQRCTTKFFSEAQIFEPLLPGSAGEEFRCSQNLDVRMQIYHINNPNAYNLTAEGYPDFCCKWSSEQDSEWSTMELYDSYFEHSISPLAHPTKVWDKVYRHQPKDSKCSTEFEYFGYNLENIMPQQIADNYGATNPLIPGNCVQAIDSSTPLMGEDIRRDIDNRTYLWWSFPWYPDEHYAYIIETNNSMVYPEIYFTTADLGDDGIRQSNIKLEDNMFHNYGTWALSYPNQCLNIGIVAESCNTEMTWNNITVPVDLGVSVLYTEGHGYGVRGFNITDSATVYPAISTPTPPSLTRYINSGYEFRTPLNGIMFYDRLPKQFNSSNDRLTFTMPFTLPDVTNTNSTDFLEKAIVTTCVQGLDDNLVPLSDESWNCNQQVATDHVIISGRSTDVNTSANILNAQNTWGAGICYNNYIAFQGCNQYGPNGTMLLSGGGTHGFFHNTISGFGGGFEFNNFNMDRALMGINDGIYGDAFLNGSTYLKYTMSFEYFDTPIQSPVGSPQCQYSSSFYSYACRGDGVRIFLHDFAGEEMDEDSQLINSMYVFQGGNLTNANSTFPAEEGYFNHEYFRQPNDVFPSFVPSYTYANGISKWNNSVHLKHYNWRPFHTTELTEGTLANINPVQTQEIFEFNLIVIHDEEVYTGTEAWEIVPTIVKGIETGDIMLDSYNFEGTGIPLQFADLGPLGTDFKELYHFVEQTTEQCRSLDPSGNGEGGYCKPGMLNWDLREVVSLEGVILQEVNLPFIAEIVDFIVNRIEENLNAVLELILFAIPFTIFAVGVAIIWHGTRMLVYLIRGELDMAQELADLDRFGMAGISKSFKNLDIYRRRPKE